MSSTLHMTVLAALTKHQEAGVLAVVIAVVLVLLGGIRLAAKAAAFAGLLFIGAVVVAVVAVLLLTRAI